MFPGDDLAPDFRRIAIRNPIELGHQLEGTHAGRGVAMAIQAEAHVERLFLLHLDHLIDAAVAAHAAYARRDVRLMIKINVVRQPVNPHPRYRLAGRIALAYDLESRTLVLDAGVTVHTGFGGGDGGVSSFVHRGMAVKTIEAELAHVQLVAVGAGLLRLIAGIDHRRVRKVGVGNDAPEQTQPEHGPGNLQHQIGRLRKDGSHQVSCESTLKPATAGRRTHSKPLLLIFRFLSFYHNSTSYASGARILA